MDTAVNDKACIPSRVVLGLLVFTVSAASYMHFSNLGVIIVNMVVPPETSIVGDPKCVSGNGTTIRKILPPPDIAKRFHWDEIVQSVMLGAHGVGFGISHIPGGLLSDRFGPRRLVFWTCLISSFCTALIPVCSHLHYALVIVLRIITGLCGGVVTPAMHTAIAQWVPPREKSKFVWCTIGGAFGTMITFPLCGIIMDYMGWEAAFYFTAIFMLVICMAWLFLMHNTPQEHPYIKKQELQYIQNAIGNDIAKAKLKFPAKKALTSVPVLVLLLSQIGDSWGLFFPMSYGPKYMKEALGFNIQETGGLSALPYLGRLMFGVIFSAITDFIRSREIMSVTCLRKVMTIFSHFVPAAFLFLVGVVGCDPYIAIMCLTLSLAFNGSAVGSCLVNPHDLAPNFAGTIFGIQSGVAGLITAASGFVTGAIIHKQSGLKEWQIIWGIGGGLYAVTAVAYLIWGTGERQEWNEPAEHNQEASNTIPTVQMDEIDKNSRR